MAESRVNFEERLAFQHSLQRDSFRGIGCVFPPEYQYPSSKVKIQTEISENPKKLNLNLDLTGICKFQSELDMNSKILVLFSVFIFTFIIIFGILKLASRTFKLFRKPPIIKIPEPQVSIKITKIERRPSSKSKTFEETTPHKNAKTIQEKADLVNYNLGKSPLTESTISNSSPNQYKKKRYSNDDTTFEEAEDCIKMMNQLLSGDVSDDGQIGSFKIGKRDRALYKKFEFDKLDGIFA